MWSDESRLVTSMALFRVLSGTVEVAAALLMLHFGRLETAFQINAALGLFGPTIMVIVSMLGLVGLAGKISYGRLGLIAAGVLLILYAARK
jgi:Protein of unknown function (DUF2619).